jgi:small multidrug resistance pump
MPKWVILGGAIVLEVAATLALRATVDNSWWAVLTVVGYLGAIRARVFFKDALTKRMAAGVALVAAGVLIIELGATTH